MKGKTQPHNTNIYLLIMKFECTISFAWCKYITIGTLHMITERSLEIPITPIINNDFEYSCLNAGEWHMPFTFNITN